MPPVNFLETVSQVSVEAAKGFSTIRVPKHFDKLPFDELAKLSSEATMALGAAPVFAICGLFCSFIALSLIRWGLTWDSMGRAMRAPDTRQG